ncbi:MAG: hypothetical protein GF347_00270 [Candidatus Moranbacteria bacterium]|nr:hypothetical protein [Candidatus Moranbacteria bacterium]
MAKKTIFVDVDEEIPSIIERIKRSKSKDINVVIPVNAAISLGMIGLKILKNESEKLDKKIIVSSKDSKCLTLAKKAGIKTSTDINFNREEEEPEELENDLDEQAVKEEGEESGEKVKKVEDIRSFKKDIPLIKEEEESGEGGDNLDKPVSGIPPTPIAPPVGNRKDLKIKKISMYPKTNHKENLQKIDSKDSKQKTATVKQSKVSEDASTLKEETKTSNPIEKESLVKKPYAKSKTSTIKPKGQTKSAAAEKDLKETGQDSKAEKETPTIKTIDSVSKSAPVDTIKKKKKLGSASFKKKKIPSAAPGEPVKIEKKITDLKEKDKSKEFRESKSEKKEEALDSFLAMQKDNEKKEKVILKDQEEKGTKKESVIREKSKAAGRKRINLLPTSSVNIFFVFLIFLIGIAFATFTFVLQKTTVELELKKQSLEYNLNATVSTDQKELNYKDKIIPAEKFEYKIEEQYEFEATGKAEPIEDTDRVFGVVTVYNYHSRSPEVLIAGTRLESEEGLMYVIREKVWLDGYTMDGDEVVPSKKNVEVYGEEEGDEYAISSGKLTVPGLKGDERYENIYAEIEEPLQEPNEIITTSVSEEDIEKAKEEAGQKIKASIKEKLEAENKGIMIIEKSIQIKDPTLTSTKSEGTRAETFKIKATAEAEAIAYKKDDLEKLADYYTKKEIEENEEMSGTHKVKITNTRIDEGLGVIELFLDIQSETTRKINEQELKNSIKDHSQEDAEYKLNSLEYIEKATVENWPFWVKDVTDKEENVTIKD